MAEKIVVSAKEVLSDLRAGISDAQLMAKYGLSEKGLRSMFAKLEAKKVVSAEDLTRRASARQPAVELDVTPVTKPAPVARSSKVVPVASEAPVTRVAASIPPVTARSAAPTTTGPVTESRPTGKRWQLAEPVGPRRRILLPRVTPLSVFGVLFCCAGVLWTTIDFYRMCDAINLISNKERVQGWSCFVPIYSNLYLSRVCEALNDIILEHNLSVRGVEDNVALNVLFPWVPLYNLFKTYNDVATEMEYRL